jgi:hypothetical protein
LCVSGSSRLSLLALLKWRDCWRWLACVWLTRASPIFSRKGASPAFDVAHRKRNLAEYEGFVEFEDAAIDELRGLSAELITDVAKMTGM